MSFEAAETFAVVVGIDDYGLGSDWKLHGAVNDAIAFAKKLRLVGIPPDRVCAFISSPDVERARQELAGITVADARRTTIGTFIEDVLRLREEKSLLFYWAGHGFGKGVSDRILMCEDAYSDVKRALSLRRLAEYSGSNAFKGLGEQLFIVDACGYLVGLQGYESMPVPYEFTPQIEEPGVLQAVMFATPLEEGAPERSKERSGIYSSELRARLDAQGNWPPNWEVVHNEISKEFERRRARNEIAPEPQMTRWRGPSGSGFIVPATSPFLSHTPTLWELKCDRTEQVRAFRGSLREHLPKSRKPHVTIYFGHKNEGHHTLSERVLKCELPDTARKLSTSLGTAAVLTLARVPWPVPAVEARRQKDQLSVNVLGALEQTVGEPDLESALGHQSYRRYELVVVPHLVTLEERQRDFEETLAWYVDEFWAGYSGTPPLPRVAVVVGIQLAGSIASPPSGLTAALGNPRGDLVKVLKALADAPAPPTTRVLLEELWPISRDDVFEWLEAHGGLGSEANYARLADEVFDAATERVGQKLRRYVSVQRAWEERPKSSGGTNP